MKKRLMIPTIHAQAYVLIQLKKKCWEICWKNIMLSPAVSVRSHPRCRVVGVQTTDNSTTAVLFAGVLALSGPISEQPIQSSLWYMSSTYLASSYLCLDFLLLCSAGIRRKSASLTGATAEYSLYQVQSRLNVVSRFFLFYTENRQTYAYRRR